MVNTRISIIVAMDEKRGIGKDNALLFKIPEDMKRVHLLTDGHPLIMGRKTFESLGRLLPNRTHIVVTRDPESLKNISYQPHEVVASLEEGIEIGKKIEETRLRKDLSEQGEIFIFGGGQIYTTALAHHLVDKLYLTIVQGDYQADTFFPDYSAFSKVISRQTGKWEKFNYTFLDVER
jgi:dihydrofolate reductase